MTTNLLDTVFKMFKIASYDIESPFILDHLVDVGMVILPILQYTLYGTVRVSWGQGLKADVFQSDCFVVILSSNVLYG